MKTLLKIIAWVAGIGLAALVAAIVLVPLLIDPNDHKDAITARVKKHTGRDLSIEGKLEMSVFPWLGVTVGGLQLGNAAGFEDAAFAKVAGLEVRVKLAPLVFDRRLEMDKVTIRGLELYAERNAKGETNFPGTKAQDSKAQDGKTGRDSGASGEESSEGGSVKLAGFALGGVEIVDAKISWRDARSAQNVVLSKVALNTGPVSLAAPVRFDMRAALSVAKPKLDGTLSIKTTLHHAGDGRKISAEGLNLSAELAGPTLPNGKLKADVYTDASIDVPGGGAQLSALSVKLAQLLQLDGGLKISGLKTAPKATGKISVAQFNPRQLLEALGQKAPVTADAGVLTSLALAGDLTADATQVRLAPFKMVLDDSNVSGTFAARNFAKPALSFDLEVDAIDADRYLPPKAAPAASALSDNSADAPSGGTSSGGDAVIALDPLRALNVSGKLALAELKVNKLKLSDISLDIKANSGNIHLKPLRAKLYGGSYAGNIGVDARGKALKLRLDESLNGVQLRPLLKDLQGEERLSGTAKMRLRATATGSTVTAMKKEINGRGDFLFENGAIEGYNLAAMIRKAKAKFLGGAADTSGLPKRTDFSEMGGSFKIAKGVVDNRDFKAKVPLLRVTGKGKADLVAETIDYLATVSVVATSKGQGGKELTELNGVDIPVKIGGTFANPSYGFEGAIMAAVETVAKSLLSGKAQDLVKGKIDNVAGGAVKDTVGKVLGGSGDTAGGAAKAVSGALGGLLKGGADSGSDTKRESPPAPADNESPADGAAKLLKGLLN